MELKEKKQLPVCKKSMNVWACILLLIIGFLFGYFANSVIKSSIKKQANQSVKITKKINLQRGQRFYFTYALLQTGIAKDFSDKGVYFTTVDWLWSATEFITYDELLKDKTFKPLGIDPRYNHKSVKINNPLVNLKSGQIIRLKIGYSIDKYIVVENNGKSVLLRDPEISVDQWNISVPYENFNPNFFKVYR